MAQHTLAALATQEFPQIFAAAMDRQVALFDRVLTIAMAKQNLTTCHYETPESRPGACDGGVPCRSLATVHELASEMEFCAAHFAAGER